MLLDKTSTGLLAADHREQWLFHKKALEALSGLILITVFTWFFVSREQQIRASVADRDSIAYWAAGKLLLSHHNPYAAPDVLSLQREQSYNAKKPLVLRTPPWSLWMVLPLGLLDPYWAWVVWLVVLLGSLLFSIRLTWWMYGDGGRPPTVFLVAGYLFAPVPACLVAGQLGLVLLLGIMLFFLLEERHPFLAGAVLLIPFAKPHLLSLLWLILAVWIIARKKWSMIGGFMAALVSASALALAFVPHIFSDYREMVTKAAIQYEFIPAFSGVVRLIFFRRFFWVQFLPMAAALLWSGWFYWTNRRIWSWRHHGPALLVVSVVTAPYAWMTDEAILLPAVLQGVLWTCGAKDKLRLKSQLIILVFACLDTLLLLLLRAKIPFATGIYFWSSLVWVSWYWYSQTFRHTTATTLQLKHSPAKLGENGGEQHLL
jgi:hypothetical protein